MTLATCTSHNFDNQSEAKNLSDDEVQSESNNDVIGFNYDDVLVQSLGHPDRDLVPNVGKVWIEHSSGVHFGDKNFYHGPVTIKQVVYANGEASLPADCDKGKENLTFQSDTDNSTVITDFEAVNSKDTEVSLDAVNRETGAFRKGFIWLQNVSKHRPLEITIFITVVLLFIAVLVLVILLRQPSPGNVLASNSEPDLIKPIGYDSDLTASSQLKNKLRMISRYEWVAQPPLNDTRPLVTPVPYVIIHHTATENCSSQSQCVFHVRQIQTFHIESRGWGDIGYNFLVGGDGSAYEGRGWTVEGAHVAGWNVKSIGIAFVGTFITRPPPEIQVVACQKLIALGIDMGYIRKDYKLLGARQFFATESPGSALMNLIRKWPHWVKEPL